MRLITLGGMRLEGAAYGRVKPLLLLSYLTLEGPRERRYLAELFWPQGSDRMNSLSVALTRLRKAAPGVVEADEVRAWSPLETDVTEMQSALAAGQIERALALYGGPFLDGVYLPGWSAELEEWLYARREDLAAALRRASLRFAEGLAAQGKFAEAAERAEAALGLAGAPEPEPEELTRLYQLLLAGDSPRAPEVCREAAAYGLSLQFSPEDARTRLQRLLIGRGRERDRLLNLAPGEWAWLKGGPGMGKTVLLRSLGGSYLPGRSGLPYATLEPLIGEESVREGEAALLARLLKLDGLWLVDNWDRVDAESRQLLGKLQALRPRARVVVASRGEAPFAVDATLELGPLAQGMLTVYPGAWERTRGLPALVEAFVHGEPLHHALETRLTALSPSAREVYLSLALLDKPDLSLARRALDLDAGEMARATEELLAAGLIGPSGQARVRQAAQEYLGGHPTVHGPLSLQLARVLNDTDAFALYRASRPLWSPDDEPGALEAYLAWGRALLRRGFPAQAAEMLTEAPASPAARFLIGRALERAGRFQEALAAVADLSETPAVLALRATLLWRLGQVEAARDSAEQALGSDQVEVRAEANNVLGSLAFAGGDHRRAVRLFSRAATLWQAANERARWVGALNNQAVSRVLAGEDAEGAFRQALEAAGDHPTLRVTVLNNLGRVHEQRGELDEARRVYTEGTQLLDEVGALGDAAQAWSNLGVILHKQQRLDEARHAYEQAVERAQRAGARSVLAMALANLAELNEDEGAWEEALTLLSAAGHAAMVERYRTNLPADHPFRARTGHPT